MPLIKPEPKPDLKRKISEILVKWGMPTRQAAIDEIIEEFIKFIKTI